MSKMSQLIFLFITIDIMSNLPSDNYEHNTDEIPECTECTECTECSECTECTTGTENEVSEFNEYSDQLLEIISNIERTESPNPNGYFDYFWIISKVLRDKCWHTLFTHFDMFETVHRIYPNEESYSWRRLLDNPSLILPNLYLGSAFNAADYKCLKKHKINIIVNVTDSISNFYPEDFKYYQYPVEDIESSSLLEYYAKFVDLVTSSPPETKFLVHCFAGRSRSASLVLYYLIKSQNMHYDQALKYLKHKRPLININQEFADEIKSLIK